MPNQVSVKIHKNNALIEISNLPTVDWTTLNEEYSNVQQNTVNILLMYMYTSWPYCGVNILMFMSCILMLQIMVTLDKRYKHLQCWLSTVQLSAHQFFSNDCHSAEIAS